MDYSGIISIVGLLLSIANSILHAINHKKLVSTCCSKRLEFGVDITTPLNTPQSLPPPTEKPVRSSATDESSTA